MRNRVYKSNENSFLVALRGQVDESLKDMIDSVIKQAAPKPFIYFEGFGSVILANCESRESILETTVQMRNSKEAVNFRKWLKEMDEALITGDILAIAKSMRDISEVISMTRRSLGLDATEQKVELQLGLSPTINIDLQTSRNILSQFKPKPYHLTFLRKHFVKTLKNANAWPHIQRLFPDLRQFKSYNSLPLSDKLLSHDGSGNSLLQRSSQKKEEI